MFQTKEKLSQYELAQLAIEYNLYMPDWILLPTFKDIISKSSYTSNYISLLFKDDTPIAVATICLDNFFLNVFVTPSFRGFSLGSIVVNNILKELNLKHHQVFAGYGEYGSDIFYQKLGIACFKQDIEFTTDEINKLIEDKTHYFNIINSKIIDRLSEYNMCKIPHQQRDFISLIK